MPSLGQLTMEEERRRSGALLAGITFISLSNTNSTHIHSVHERCTSKLPRSFNSVCIAVKQQSRFVLNRVGAFKAIKVH